MPYTATQFTIWTIEKYYNAINEYVGNSLLQDVDINIVIKDEELIELDLSDALIQNSGIPNLILINDNDIEMYLENFPNTFSHFNDIVEINDFPIYKLHYVNDTLMNYPFSLGNQVLFYRTDLINLEGVHTWDELISVCNQCFEENHYKLLPGINKLVKIITEQTGIAFYDEANNLNTSSISASFNVLNNLNNANLLYTEDEALVESNFINGNIFGVIGDYEDFSNIKRIVEENSLPYEFGLIEIPKTDVLQYNTSSGNYSFMAIETDDVDIDLIESILDLFCDETTIRDCAYSYDILCAYNYENHERYSSLDNDGCFITEDVIKKISMVRNIPFIYKNNDYLSLIDEYSEQIVRLSNGALYSDVYSQITNIFETSSSVQIPYILDHIEIEGTVKTEYYIYERFETSSIRVIAYFTNGVSREVWNYNYNDDELLLDDNVITISYSSGGVTDSINININVSNRVLTDLCVYTIDKTRYYQDLLTNNDFLVCAIYNVGENRPITNYTIIPSTLNSVDNNIITIGFEGENKEITIEAVRKLTNISIIQKPRKLSYYNGQRFNKGEMIVWSYYNDNSLEEITNYGISPKIVTFENGSISRDITISYTKDGITKNKSLTVYKNVGSSTDDTNITLDYIENGLVNLYDRSLKYIINDFNSPSELLPVSINHLYIPNENNSSVFGMDFILSLEERISLESGAYYYRDSIGKIYHFVLNEEEVLYSELLEASLNILESSIEMIYKNGDIKVFSLINNNYFLTKVHYFPSNDENIIPTKSYKIIYQNGMIYEIKPISNNNPVISFTYTNSKLSRITYNDTTLTSYEYQDNRLKKITRCNQNTNLNKEIEFNYTNNSFTVIDKSSKDTFDNYRHQEYEFTNNKVIRIKEGYSNEEIKTISYYNDSNLSDTIDGSTVIRYKDKVKVYSFYNNTLVSSSSYKVLNNTDTNTIKAVYETNSFGFDLLSFENSYSNSLSLYSNNNVVTNTLYTFDDVSVSEASDVVITFFIKTSANVDVRINNELFNRINTHDYYQFLAIPVRLENTLLIVSLSSISRFSVTRIKIIKKPYIIPELPTPIYDTNNNLCDYYTYNHLTNNNIHSEITYNEYNQIESKCVIEDVRISLLENTYNARNELSLIKSYGLGNNHLKSSYLYDLNGRIISEDNSHIETSYEYGTNYKKITNYLNNDTSIQTKANYYNNSNVLSSIEVNNHNNSYTYNNYENINEANIDNDFYLNYSYNTYESLRSINIGDVSLVLIDSDDKHINRITCPNGLVKSFTYDDSDRLIEVRKTNQDELVNTYSFTYSDDEYTTTISNDNYTYIYSKLNTNNITSRYEMLENNTQVFKIDNLALNINGNVSTKNYYLNNNLVDTLIATSDYYSKITNIVNQISNISYIYNSLNQLESKSNYLSNTLFMTNSYSYKGYGNNEYSNLILAESFNRNNTILDSYTYTYYDNGNINRVLCNNNNHAYYIYDNENRLLWEYNYSFNKAYNYTYDNKGNITSKNTYDLDSNESIIYNTLITDTYDYEVITPNSGQNEFWKDQLKSYNNSIISYDEYGNPISYLNHNLSWVGRSLVSYDDISFTYDYKGIRLSKNDIKYYYENNSLKVETNSSYTIIYYYDNEGICGFKYNNLNYYYQKNQSGDIIGIYNDLGVIQIKYIYDSFGNHKIYDNMGNELLDDGLNIGSINPFRYRSYYYDRETNLYYLISRYYDARLGRFISPDSIEYLDPESISGYNLYAYCGNNPVMLRDEDGTFGVLGVIGIAVEIISLLATINDIYQIFSGNIFVSSNAENVSINNSYKIVTPWMQYGYSFYLNHINSNTRNVIKGCSSGVQFEWMTHNMAYVLYNALGNSMKKNQAMSVDVGKTIFSDNDHGELGSLMKHGYMIFDNPIYWVIDLFVNGGYK